jgi:hypothetical protein
MTMEHSIKNETNTTDATTGQSLRARVAARKAELEAAIANPVTDERTRDDLRSAASQVEGLLTGDLDRIPKVVAVSLSAWLENNKHLDEHHPSALPPGAGSHNKHLDEHHPSALPPGVGSREPCVIAEPPAACVPDKPLSSPLEL